MIVTQKDKYSWPSKLDFFAYVLVLGNGSNLFPRTLFSLHKYSGGLLLISLLITALLIALPSIYVELFLGRYTRRTNTILHKACPLFIGLTIIILFMNCLLLPLETVAQSQFFLKAVWYAKMDLNKVCPAAKDTECYDYVTRGPVKKNCSYITYGANCVDLGIVRYPNQYYYWQFNINPASNNYKQWQYILSLLATWILIAMCLFVSFRQIAKFLKVCFLMALIANFIVLAMALYQDGSQKAIKKLTELKLHIDETFKDDLISMVIYSCKKYGLIIPIGYTTISAYVKFKSKFLQEAALIITLDITYTLFLCIVTSAVTGVIAHQMNVDYLLILTNDVGMYFTIFPEFFRFIQVPWVFNVVYIVIIGFCDLGRLALAFYLLFLNLFDFLPTGQKFHTQIVICYCTICFIYTLLFTQQFTMIYVIPYIEYVFYHNALLLLLILKSTMLYYFYGIHRLSDDIYFMTGKKPIGFLTATWSITPMLLTIALILELESNNKIFGDILEKIKEISFGKIWKMAIDYGMWIIMSFIAFISMFYLVWSKNLGKPFLSSLKPDFYWGIPTKLNRMRRKNFSSTYGDRSKTTRRRRKLEKVQIEDVEDEEVTQVEVDHDTLEGIQQFQEYFKGMFRKQKKEKRKGRIFSDTTNFKNLQNTAYISTRIKYIK